MPRGKSDKPAPWERATMLMVNGGVFTKEDIVEKTNYEYGYRISTLMYLIKVHGGIVKVHKNGRKVSGYELINTQEMIKYLSRRGFKPMQLDKIEKLEDLGATKIENNITVEEVEEV